MSHNAITVERNGTNLAFSQFKILKGKRANTEYPAPVVSVDNIAEVIEWIGTANLVNELQTLLKRKFQNIYDQAVGEDGVFNLPLFLKYASEFTSAGLKLKEIADKLDVLKAELTKLIDGADLTSHSVQGQVRELNDQIRAYRQMKEDRQRKPKEEAEAEASVAV